MPILDLHVGVVGGGGYSILHTWGGRWRRSLYFTPRGDRWWRSCYFTHRGWPVFEIIPF